MIERRRLMLLGGVTAASLALVAAAVVKPLPRLVWNASASAPIGLYRVSPGVPVGVGDMVIARLPFEVRQMAAQRGYLPLGVPLVKRVVAAAGSRVCASGATVTIDGRAAAVRRAVDRRGRNLPVWTGCRTLRPGELLLVMENVPDSFDGRYFGPTNAREVVGKAIPLWVR